jgi:hypothetical protein
MVGGIESGGEMRSRRHRWTRLRSSSPQVSEIDRLATHQLSVATPSRSPEDETTRDITTK